MKSICPLLPHSPLAPGGPQARRDQQYLMTRPVPQTIPNAGPARRQKLLSLTAIRAQQPSVCASLLMMKRYDVNKQEKTPVTQPLAHVDEARIPAKVETYEVLALLDTGSQVTAVSNDVVIQLQKQHTVNKDEMSTIKSASGHFIVTLGTAYLMVEAFGKTLRIKCDLFENMRQTTTSFLDSRTSRNSRVSRVNPTSFFHSRV